MKNNLFKIIISLCLSILLLCNFSYADVVVIGTAPGATNGKNVAQNVGTNFIQSQYTGPGTLPSSANTGASPIQTNKNIDGNGVIDNGPSVNVITSPAANNAALSQNKNGSNVISNSAGGSLSDTGIYDVGPTTIDIISPGANTPHYSDNYYNNSGAIGNASGPNQSPISSITGTSNSVGGSQFPNSNNFQQNTSNQTNTTIPIINNNNNINTDSGLIIYQANDTILAQKPVIKAPAAIVVNATTKQIYYSKDGFGLYAPAALTNLVTAYILLSNKGLEELLPVSYTAVTGLESGASTAGLKAGDTISVRDAIAAMFVQSCCDVSNVVAENISGNIASFVALMNQTIKSWGCLHTNFANPTGLNHDAQVTTVYDMAIIMDKVSSNPHLKTFLSLTSYTLPATASRGAKQLTSKNNLMKPGNSSYYAGLGASRMGYTSKAKYTVASQLDYNGNRIVSVVLKANGSQFTDTIKLLNYAKVASIEAANNGSSAIMNNKLNQVYSSLNVNISNTNTNTNVNTNVNNNVNTNVQNTTVSNNVPNTAQNNTLGTWLQDGRGWYFKKQNGQIAKNEWIQENGKQYCVDENGYMITGWREFTNGNLYYFDPSSGEFRYNTWVNVSTGSYYLQADGSLARANPGTTKNIVTSLGTYTIDETGKALAKIN